MTSKGSSTLGDAALVLLGISVILGFFYAVYLAAFKRRKFPLAVILTWLLSLFLFPIFSWLWVPFIFCSLVIWAYGILASWKWVSGLFHSV